MPTLPRPRTDDGPLDVEALDAPHALADLEHWQATSHLRDPDGAELSLFATFHRMAFADPLPEDGRRFAHAVTWAVADPLTGAYHRCSVVDRSVPSYLRRRLPHIVGVDRRIARALAEVFDRNRVPLPDRLMATEPAAAAASLDLDLDGCRLSRRNGGYDLRLVSPEGTACELRLDPNGPPVRHGTDGVIRVGDDQEVHHYFRPDCAVSGRVVLPDGRTFTVEEGTGWFEHQFGTPIEGPATAGRRSWIRMNVTLGDGGAVSLYELVEPSTQRPIDRSLLLLDADGTIRRATDFDLRATGHWRSSRTFRDYPIAYELTCGELGVHLVVEACSADQELVTALAAPAFWQGRCTARGTIEGRPVDGHAALLQRSPTVETLETMLGRIGEVVISAVDDVLPRHPTGDRLHDVIGTASARMLQGVDIDLIDAAIVEPIRAIVDRRGKAWRSYILVACCEAVGGDGRALRQVLALPEIVHTGSLIIDDVEDGSTTRRGGPACHVEFGEALAINAGNAAYFVALAILMSSDSVVAKPDPVKLELYDLYFRAMRGAHAGQAMDLYGAHDLMPSAVSDGKTRALEARILACYRFKTGVPSACFASMGAVLGGGSPPQISVLSDFMVAAGVAFQVIDDVLNLTGFEHGIKAVGEDVRNGTVTLPLARALGSLRRRRERQELWSLYLAAAEDPDVIPDVLERLDRNDSLGSCRATAEELVERAWPAVERVLEPSHASVALRAFSWFVLERQI